jgi:hypothetical protein
MTKQTRNNLIAALVTVLMWGLMLAGTLGSSGCAGQGLVVEYADGNGKEVIVDTDYQVENGFTMERDGDGYRIELGSATTKDAELGLVTELVRAMREILAATYGIPAAAPASSRADPPDD